MFEILLQSIQQKVLLTSQQQELCTSFFTLRNLRKKEFLVRQHEICEYTVFVEKGVLRSYATDAKGSEHIVQFAFEGWWMTDFHSFLTGEPSLLNIEAVEDADVLLTTKEANDELFRQIPLMERYFRLLTQNALMAMQRRMIVSLSHNAEEKYTRLLDTFPGILQKVPQHMIASYLGITAETLSRIRKQISIRK